MKYTADVYVSPKHTERHGLEVQPDAVNVTPGGRGLWISFLSEDAWISEDDARALAETILAHYDAQDAKAAPVAVAGRMWVAPVDPAFKVGDRVRARGLGVREGTTGTVVRVNDRARVLRVRYDTDGTTGYRRFQDTEKLPAPTEPTFAVGDRVRGTSTGAMATIVEHDRGGIYLARFDEDGRLSFISDDYYEKVPEPTFAVGDRVCVVGRSLHKGKSGTVRVARTLNGRVLLGLDGYHTATEFTIDADKLEKIDATPAFAVGDRVRCSRRGRVGTITDVDPAEYHALSVRWDDTGYVGALRFQDAEKLTLRPGARVRLISGMEATVTRVYSTGADVLSVNVQREDGFWASGISADHLQVIA